MTVQRFKKQGKFYYVLREKNGRILDLRKAEKGITVKKLNKIANRNRSLRENVKNIKLTLKYEKKETYKSIEIKGRGLKKTRTLKLPKTKRNYQILAETRIGRERLYASNYRNADDKEKDALNNLYKMIDEHETGGYDAESGMKIAKKMKLKIRISRVSYLKQ